ncbi:hypothetical protein HID58_006868 [Brassica napus]|uniref:non-specific serine/threonine protein kinase n=1 Tax=Brassica napus TaxID=3708 RepID=A0ABQ8ECQ1_BRANA|nr:hypothetical protein HID58_006868 [Brassica napus]
MSTVFSRFTLLFITISFVAAHSTSAASLALLHPDELKALEEIASTLGIPKLNLLYVYGDPCYMKKLNIDVANPGSENIIACDCSFNNSRTCHITELRLKTLGLPGKLPPELVKLPYLRVIDLCRNYLSGPIPMEWALMPYLTFISVCANNLTGPLPTGLQNFKNLTFLGLEANQLSGPIPDELGNLTSLTGLILGSNQFTGSLPATLARLVNLEDFRISDNNFNGIIPGYIGNWSGLLSMRISDITGIESFPNISSQSMHTLDVSFNKLSGEVQTLQKAPGDTYLNDNILSGKVGSAAFLNNESYIDLSYNNFTYPSGCSDKRYEYQIVNWTFTMCWSNKMQIKHNNFSVCLPCFYHPKPGISNTYVDDQRYLHINCGGENVVVTNSSHKIAYQADNSETKATTNQHFQNWGVSSTGRLLNDIYIITSTFTLSEDYPTFYKSARQAAQSLVYYAFCLENGSYTVKLHFMEIQFSNEEPYNRLGRRIFDIYVQGELLWRDFNIKEEASGTRNPIVKEANVNVANHLLEIRLYWAGKGTTLIPKRGNYGPIISAISLCHSTEKTKHHTNYPFIFGITVVVLAITLLAFGLYTQKRCKGDKNTRERDLRALGLQTVCFTWRQLQVATKDFDQNNKLGEGGFGSVFKGELSDGTIIAVKQLSSKSCQGNREFVNEIGMISGLNHPNLVKLYGCCVEKNELLLVYEYMENNSLALALSGKSSLKLDWATRQKICVGIARGIDFLHQGSMIRMVHRDIKTTNVLLDTDLNAKISDFGLARLHEAEHTHISTKIAGTIGYMAPEYALYGQLTEKADVFSFGVVAMEIVSGKSNMKQTEMLEGEFNSKEAEVMIKVGLACTNSSPLSRPTMSEAVQMLEGETEITQVLSDPGLYGSDWNISKMRSTDTHGSSSTSGLTDQTATTMKSFVSGAGLYPLYPDSMILNSTVDFSSPSL